MIQGHAQTKGSGMYSNSDASRSQNKHASTAPFGAIESSPLNSTADQNSFETATFSTDQNSDGKENRVPLIGGNWGHPNITMRRRSRISAAQLPSTLDLELPTAPTLLGKRLTKDTLSKTWTETLEDESNADRKQRDSLAVSSAVTHFEARALVLHAESLGLENKTSGSNLATMLVDDHSRIGELHFGSVALGDRKSKPLTLENANDKRNARVKYDGYVLMHSASESGQTKTRFKCDLHVCVIDALKSLTLRVTFEPLPLDVGRQVTAMLKFTVNDRYKLQCRATGNVVPRIAKISEVNRGKSGPATVVIASKTSQGKKLDENTRDANVDASLIGSDNDRASEQEAQGTEILNVGNKRRSSVAIDISPPRNGYKRRKCDPLKALGSEKSNGNSVFAGSWWKQRQSLKDEGWMAKQTEGFTKWMNYVLLDGTAERLSDGDARDDHEGLDTKSKHRFDFSSLRVLAQKRMESKWTQAAVELYQSPGMEDILFNLQDEIGNKGIVFRADRPVYADVGLQEELISLLNNYHPVWLCLGLYAVLGSQIMRDERCSLRAIFRATSTRLHNAKNESTSNRKMPQVLRRIIVKHLIKDAHVARNYRLVQHLMTPMDGSTADRNDGGNAFINLKKNINGREYFDSLTQSFMLKFFMLVLFLDCAIERKIDTFAHFPCLFRIAPATQKNVSTQTQLGSRTSQDDKVWVKNSQVFVTEFCRLFLASEGRIDKHLKLLGYTLKYEQTPLDEIDLEVTNLKTDLRDGVRLAKLMEALTTRPSSFDKNKEDSGNTRCLSTFLRVPALSRLQKVHNVEICLHFLQDKCGVSVLDALKSSGNRVDERRKVNGRVCVSSSGFAGLQSRVNEKVVESLAKDIVNGHREKTLALLWQLISCFQLQSLVDAFTMKQEIANVIKRMSYRAKDFFDTQQQSAPLLCTTEHECYTLLLEWCRAVCANYDVEVRDFSESFADGKALCYLLHYYHPMLLSKSDVLPTTRDIREESIEAMREKLLLVNEERHFATVNDRIKQLGEVPVLMPQQYNSKNPPEEKMVVTFVCYLQSRLMDSYGEIHAASRLKRWWQSPWIRLRLYRQKNRSARVVQRFWYTSSQKRLAIRQCRKLLRAAHIVKCTVQMWATKWRYLRLRRSVIAIQRAFRKHQQMHSDGDIQEAATVIQYYWRKKLEMTHEKSRRALELRQQKVVEQVQMIACCAVIERTWLQYLSREGARLVRQQLIADRWAAASMFQAAWRQRHWRHVARKQRQGIWRQQRHAARVLQQAWKCFRHRREETQRLVALQRLKQMMRDEELQTKRFKLKQKVETRAATCVQKGFRMFTLRKREAAVTKVASVYHGTKQRRHFLQQKQAVATLQRNVRVWRRTRHFLALTQFYNMLMTYQRMKISEAQERALRLHKLKHKIETRAACRIQKRFRRYRFQTRTRAATTLQTLARCWIRKKCYCSLRRCACLVQRNVRVWRRKNQLQALLLFRKMLLDYRRFQREEERRLEQLRQSRLKHLRERVEHRAANRVQAVYRVHAHQRRMIGATLFQAAFRGYTNRLRYASTYMSVVVIQRAAHAWIARANFERALRSHRAAVSIQRHVRGWSSRRLRFDFYTLKTHLQRLRMLVSCWQIELWFRECTRKYRRKRTLMVRAHWTRLSAAILRKRSTLVNRIAACWRLFCLKRVVDGRIEHKRLRDAAAQRIQVWWLELCCKWSERKQRIEEKRQREMLEMALAMAKARAERIVAVWLCRNVVAPYRARNVYVVTVRKLQAWWRGVMVRLHHCTEEVTRQRKKLCTMKLVEHESHASSNLPSRNLEHLRVEVRGEASARTEPSQTLGTRLDQALHMLMYGERLQDMLFASYTIEVCTRYSRECCRKCVQLRISSTIFGAIRGLNRSRPHVELLHQLLLVLRNLTMYRRSADKRKSKTKPVMALKDVKKRLEVDLRALDTLVDLLHIHRDMHHVFVLSAKVITYYLEQLRPLVSTNEDVHESWSGAEKRLSGLQELLARKLALYNATASFRRVNQMPDQSVANNLMRKMNPKTANSIMEQIMQLLER